MPLYNIKKIITKRQKVAQTFSSMAECLPSPVFLLIHLTLSCTRSCKWCYQRNDDFFSSHYGNISISEFEKILIGSKSKFWLRSHIHLYGGEPLFHPDFPLFLKCSRKHGYKPTLTTNGDYLDRFSDDIIKSSLSQINISVNGLISYEGCINSDFGKKISKFVNRNHGRKTINLNYAVEPYSYSYIEDTILYFNDNFKRGDFAYFILQHLYGVSKDKDPGIDVKKLKYIFERIRKFNLKFGLLFLPDINICDIDGYYNSSYTFRNKCYVPWHGLTVYPDLEVAPGGAILGCNYILGDLNHDSIIDIWKGTKLRDFRRRLVMEGLPKVCNRCCHKIYY